MRLDKLVALLAITTLFLTGVQQGCPDDGDTAESFNALYGNDNYNEFLAVRQASDGNYIAVGRQNGEGSCPSPDVCYPGSYWGWVVKVGPDGSRLWARDILDADMLGTLEVDSGGMVYMGGKFDRDDVGHARPFVSQSDQDGRPQWTTDCFSEVSTGEAKALVVHSDGSLSVLATLNVGDGVTDTGLAKISGDGEELWTERVAYFEDEAAYDLVGADDGGYYINATGTLPGTDTSGGGIYRLNPDLSLDWFVELGGNEVGGHMIGTSDGSLLVSGRTSVEGQGENASLVKLSSAGTVLWKASYGGLEKDSFLSVAEVPEGGYIAAGGYDMGGDMRTLLVRTDAGGGEMWSALFGDDGEIGYSVQPSSAGGFIVAGEADSYGGAILWAQLIKTDVYGMAPERP